MKLVLVLVLVLAPTLGRAEPLYASTTRVAHLRQALDALSKLGATARHALELALHDAIRARCSVGTTRPSTTCLAAVGREVCAGKPDCLAAADVMLTNEHAEHDLVDDATRMRLVRGSADYHAAVGAELWATYALLASELALAPPAADLAAQIDAFCAGRDRTVHACEAEAKGCLPSLPYQRCAAGLVWFVGNQEAAR